MHINKLFLIAMLILISACTNQSNSISSRESDKVEEPSEQFLMDLRETMNLSFKIFQAMENNDYAFLESSKATGVTIDKENNKVKYEYSGEEIAYDFLTGINLSNLEYWGSGYINDHTNFQIIFAKYFNDTHGTIYLDFVKEDNKWLFNGLSTNA